VVSIPDDVFEKAERIRMRTGKSRSALYTVALREYLARHAPDEVAAIDAVLDKIGGQTTASSARRRDKH
jgi:metal-responsive CopG/Arc/MetJ family transcriptional regulator